VPWRPGKGGSVLGGRRGEVDDFVVLHWGEPAAVSKVHLQTTKTWSLESGEKAPGQRGGRSSVIFNVEGAALRLRKKGELRVKPGRIPAVSPKEGIS